MEIEFKQEADGAWYGSYISKGINDVTVFRNAAEGFYTSFGSDNKDYVINYNPGCFPDDKVVNLHFVADIPEGMTVYLVSESEVKRCIVSEKTVSVGNSIADAIPEASPASDGLMLSTDKVKLNGIEPMANKYTLNKASDTSLGGIMTGHVNKVLYEYPVELDSEGRAFVSVPQRELSGMKMIEFESYANDYTGIWSTSASDVTHMDFVMGDNIDAGNINDTFRWRFTSNNLLGSKVLKPQDSDLHTIMELLPHGTKAGELKIADTAGVLQHVLTKADFVSIPTDITSANIADVLKQIIGILKP